MRKNNVLLIGRLVADPNMNYTPGGKGVCNIRIAVEREFKNQNGEYDADFINVTFWEKKAEFIANYLNVGTLVYIAAKIVTRTKEVDGKKQYLTEIHGVDIEPLESKAVQEQRKAAAAEKQNEMFDNA